MPTAAPLKDRISKEAVQAAKKWNGKKGGQAIHRLRATLRIEASDIEKAIGMSPDRLGEIEADATGCTLQEIHQIASVFEYTTGGLVGHIMRAMNGK